MICTSCNGKGSYTEGPYIYVCQGCYGEGKVPTITLSEIKTRRFHIVERTPIIGPVEETLEYYDPDKITEKDQHAE